MVLSGTHIPCEDFLINSLFVEYLIISFKVRFGNHLLEISIFKEYVLGILIVMLNI